MKHIVTDIQHFCMHDGFGLRTTVFLKGCPLNCFWCHNPEARHCTPNLMYYENKCIGCGACGTCKQGVHTFTDMHSISFDKCIACGQCVQSCPTGALSIAGSERDCNDIIAQVLKDKAFYGEKGGITLSGGEPMYHPESCLELLRAAKAAGLNTAVETCGFFPKKYVAPLCELADCLLWDIKDTDNTRHIANTGVSNKTILENLYLADSYGVPIILRCILLKGVNLNDEHLQNIAELSRALKNAVRVDLLPCHRLGGSKAQSMGISYPDLSRYEPDDMQSISAEFDAMCGKVGRKI